jgi:hypothetical protein
MLWAFRHLRLIGGFSSKAEREWPNTEAAKTPTATKMMYMAIGTRPFPFPLWSRSYNKSYFGQLEEREKAYTDIRYLCSHAVIVTYPQTITQAVDNSGRSNTKYCVRMKGRNLMPVQGVIGGEGDTEDPLQALLRSATIVSRQTTVNTR